MCQTKWSVTTPKALKISVKSRRNKTFFEASRCNKNPKPSVITNEKTHSESLVTLLVPNRLTKYVAVALLLVCLGGLAVAQTPNRKLVMGSVYRVVRNLIEVKQEAGDLAIIKVEATTKYLDSTTQAPAKLKDIAVGDQIVIKVIVKNGVDTAEEVKFVSALGGRR